MPEFTRDQLADMLSHYLRTNADDGGMDLVEIADAILERNLIIPRSDIVGTEYGIRMPNGGWDFKAIDQSDANRLAAMAPGSVMVSHPTLPFVPLPEDGDKQ